VGVGVAVEAHWVTFTRSAESATGTLTGPTLDAQPLLATEQASSTNNDFRMISPCCTADQSPSCRQLKP